MTATDNGLPPKTVYGTVSVNVEDVNDHEPVITNLPNSTSISEGLPRDHDVFLVFATDKDYGENSRLSYNIISGKL